MPLRALLCAVIVSLLAAGCSGHTAAHPDARIVHVTEHDFRIVAPRTIPAGDVRLQVRNAGPDGHELIMIRMQSTALPLRSDGTTVDEESLGPMIVGVLEPAGPGADRELDVHLNPGRYALICNMAGHFMGGMDTVVTVE
jgi:hypothetical protein